MTPLLPAVLVTAYNRVETTTKVLEAVRDAGVRRLYFYVDAPRSADDAEACAGVRTLADTMEREADVSRLFPEKNLGPRDGVAKAISWFFEQEQEGIILEHDCLPSLDFFRFAAELLVRYRDDMRVMHITGMAPYSIPTSNADYYFIRIPMIWGWATWHRAWQSYDLQMRTLSEYRRSDAITSAVDGKRAQANWMHYFHAAAAGNLESWDFPWAYAVMRNNGYCITPVSNMVTNVGFSKDAVHCRDLRSRFANMQIEPVNWPIRHPAELVAAMDIERRLNREVFRYKTLKYMLEICGLGRVFAESKVARGLVGRIVKWGG